MCYIDMISRGGGEKSGTRHAWATCLFLYFFALIKIFWKFLAAKVILMDFRA